MRNFIKRFFCLLFWAFLTGNFGFSQQLEENIKNFTVGSGLGSSAINTVLEDKQGFMWFGTNKGLIKYDGYEFLTFGTKSGDTTTLSHGIIWDMAEDSKGNIWLATKGGVSKYDPHTENFKQYVQNHSDSSAISHNKTYSLLVDEADRVWVGHWTGLDVYNEKKDIFEPALASPSSDIFKNGVFAMEELDSNMLFLMTYYHEFILFDKRSSKSVKRYENFTYEGRPIELTPSFKTENGKIKILGQQGAIYDFNPLNGKLSLIQPNTFDKREKKSIQFLSHHQFGDNLFWLGTSSGVLEINKNNEGATKWIGSAILESCATYVIYEDSKKSIWIGTENCGLFHIDNNAKPFYSRDRIITPKEELDLKWIDNILADSKSNLWFLNPLKGITRFDPSKNKITNFEGINQYLESGEASFVDAKLIEAQNGNIWISTRYSGIIKLDPETGLFKIYDNIQGTNKILGQPLVRTIFQSMDGSIWIGSEGILARLNPKTEEVLLYLSSSGLELNNAIGKLPSYSVNAIAETKDGNILVGFLEDGLYLLNPVSHKFKKIPYVTPEICDSQNSLVTDVSVDDSDRIWIATYSGLFMYDLVNEISKRYDGEDTMSNRTIWKISNVDENEIWMVTDIGISQLLIEEGDIRNYDIYCHNGYPRLTFDRIKKVLYVAGKGYTYFEPDKIQLNTKIPPIVITSFNKYIEGGQFVKVPGMNLKESIELKHNESDFTVSFSALSYANPHKNKYAYCLDGYNNGWMHLEGKREITFTNLDAGTYTLRMKGTNNDGIWNEEGKQLTITILAPWWGSIWAKTFYVLGLGVFFAVALRFRFKQLEIKKQQEFRDLKAMLFTNVTHEFRTPITIISGANKELKKELKGKSNNLLELIERNCNNLLYLVNQLLELRKMDSARVEVDYQQSNIIKFLSYITQSYSSYASGEGIPLHFISSRQSLQMDFDGNKILLVMTNLISNAIKYSTRKGEVYVLVDDEDKYLRIRVTDSGVGIAKKDIPRVFERFYRGSTANISSLEGTGLGLAIVKETVKLLKGKINIESEIGKGTVVTVHLKKTNRAPLVSAVDNQLIKTKTMAHIPAVPTTYDHEKSSKKSNKPTLLVIEDNEDIVSYLKICLQHLWHIKIANNGKMGIEKAIEWIPDIILCDIMMPEIDGYTVLNQLKNNGNTNHIPIVMLTAKADDVSRIEALKRGADAYLVKPFDKQELIIVLQKLLHQRKVLQKRYSGMRLNYVSKNPMTKKDDRFIQNIIGLTLDPNRGIKGVEQLCKLLGMSRTQLHNKVKALTGMSTSIFIRSIRLKRAKELLETSERSVKEIAFEIGFNDVSYFIRCFKDEFGQSPSTFKKRGES
ncbi:MAG: ATP-binding protein [Cyanobacteria bacterium P01_A01_bin.84]